MANTNQYNVPGAQSFGEGTAASPNTHQADDTIPNPNITPNPNFYPTYQAGNVPQNFTGNYISAETGQNVSMQNGQAVTSSTTDTSQPSPKPQSITPTVGSNTQSAVSPTGMSLKDLSISASQGNTFAPQDLKSKYTAGLQNAQTNGGEAPQSPGAGSAGVQSNLPPPPPPQYDTSKVDTALSDPQSAVGQAFQQRMNDYAQAQTSQAQNESLTQTYSDLMDQLGIPALNTELMNMKNVIDGTEQDIRDEVTKAGGFATNSQVMALTDARNKTLIQNYNNLLQTRDDATKELTTMMDLTEKDRAYAQTKIDNQLKYDDQNIQYAQQGLKNAQDVYTTMQKSEGWDGILKAALASGDPQAVEKINSTMGAGFDLASMAQQDALTRSQAQIKTNLDLSNAELNNKKLLQEVNDSSGLPNPAKANAVGYNEQGIKYNPSNASDEILNYWKSQQAFDPNPGPGQGKIPPAFYNAALASWVKNGLSASDFSSIFGGYKDPTQDNAKNKLYN